tara:strand:- start:1217 stop:1492 length:276 start_codon:yes stop_codon:yes gene_type:complete
MIAYKIKGMDNKTGKVRYLYEDGDGRKHYIAYTKKDAKFALKTARYKLWDIFDNNYETMHTPVYNRKLSEKDKKSTWSIDTVFMGVDHVSS